MAAGIAFRSRDARHDGPMIAAVVFLLAAGAAQAAPQSAAQAKCIVAANLAAAELTGIRSKTTLSCMKAAAKASSSVNVAACTTGDPKGKVAKAAQKAIDKVSNSCVMEAPDFGYSSPSVTTTAAIEENNRLFVGVFGGSITGVDKKVRKCIGAIGKALGKLVAAEQKWTIGCKKRGLANDSIVETGGIESCIDPSDNAPPTSKAKQKLDNLLAKKCGSALPSALSSGTCASVSGTVPGAAECIGNAGDCRTCSLFARADVLTKNCDYFDNAAIDGSCTTGTCGDGMKSVDELCDASDPTPSNQVCPNSGNGLESCSTYDCTCACPDLFDFTPDAESVDSLFDRGWTGLAHDERFISDATVAVRVTGCENSTKPCGVCDFEGPVDNSETPGSDIANQRCTGNTFVKCSENADCEPSDGRCEFYFGGPLPLGSAALPICVLQVIEPSITGTVDVATGDTGFEMNVVWDVYQGLSLSQPCPRCVGDSVLNDNTFGGTCSGGARDGLSCDASGLSPVPGYGPVSLDCPPAPAARISGAGIPLDLSGSTGSEGLPLTAQSPGCRAAGYGGMLCYCDVCEDTLTPCTSNSDCQAVGLSVCGEASVSADTAPNSCTDPLQCQGAGNNEGVCATGPIDRYCDGSPEQRLQCANNADCQALDPTCPGADCGTCALDIPRECFLGDGTPPELLVGDGAPDVPANESSTPLLAATTCLGRTGNTGVNHAAGMPGPMRVTLRGLARALPSLGP